jgi:hypothetical protein
LSFHIEVGCHYKSTDEHLAHVEDSWQENRIKKIFGLLKPSGIGLLKIMSKKRDSNKKKDDSDKKDEPMPLDLLTLYTNCGHFCKIGKPRNQIKLTNKIDQRTILLKDGNSHIPYELDVQRDVIFVQKGNHGFEGELISKNGRDVIMKAVIKFDDMDAPIETVTELHDVDSIAIKKEGMITINLDSKQIDELVVSYLHPSIYWEPFHKMVFSEKKGEILSLVTYARVVNRTGYHTINAKNIIFESRAIDLNVQTPQVGKSAFSMDNDVDRIDSRKNRSVDDPFFDMENVILHDDNQFIIASQKNIQQVTKSYNIYSNNLSSYNQSIVLLQFQTKETIFPGKIHCYDERDETIHISSINGYSKNNVALYEYGVSSSVTLVSFSENENDDHILLNICISGDTSKSTKYVKFHYHTLKLTKIISVQHIGADGNYTDLSTSSWTKDFTGNYLVIKSRLDKENTLTAKIKLLLS